MKILPQNFYNHPAEIVAKELLGKILAVDTLQGLVTGKIVETEAYHQNDPASHSYGGKITDRNKPMFGPPGYSYVYFIYGMYHCFNVVTDRNGYGSAVLIRALEPLSGIEIMQKNRRQEKLKNLTTGPGKLAQAFGIDKKFNNLPLNSKKFCIYENNSRPHEIIKTTRIGLAKGADEHLRFYIKDNHFVSVK